MPSLFDPVTLGDLALPNRIVMSPLTRCRAEDGRVPGPLAVEYYAQRAGAGLIVTEATLVLAEGAGFFDTPGIYSEAQVAGWRRVTDAVHARGGRIVCQLWHCGRLSDPDILGGLQPVSSSDVPAAGHVRLLTPRRDHPVPRPLGIDELPGIIAAYRRAAENARAAGFDGVELHAANGYLIDQFLCDKVNRRTDAYGGPVGNRMRLLLEVVDVLVDVWGRGRVGVHLSPRCDNNDAGDSNPPALHAAVAAALGQRRIAFLMLREREAADSLLPMIKRAFGGAVIANELLTRDSAEAILTRGDADAAAWGRAFIANPDLVERLRSGAALATPDPETYYGRHNGARGYTDYPALA